MRIEKRNESGDTQRRNDYRQTIRHELAVGLADRADMESAPYDPNVIPRPVRTLVVGISREMLQEIATSLRSSQ